MHKPQTCRAASSQTSFLIQRPCLNRVGTRTVFEKGTYHSPKRYSVVPHIGSALWCRTYPHPLGDYWLGTKNPLSSQNSYRHYQISLVFDQMSEFLHEFESNFGANVSSLLSTHITINRDNDLTLNVQIEVVTG